VDVESASAQTALACVYDNPELQVLCRRLRAAAVERAKLQTQQEPMGADSLIVSQQARLLLLPDVVPSLEQDVRRMENPNYDQECLEGEEDERSR